MQVDGFPPAAKLGILFYRHNPGEMHKSLHQTNVTSLAAAQCAAYTGEINFLWGGLVE
jgi:hypothetical protein